MLFLIGLEARDGAARGDARPRLRRRVRCRWWLGGGAARGRGRRWGSRGRAAFVAGLALALSSTAIAMQSDARAGQAPPRPPAQRPSGSAFPGHRGHPVAGAVPLLSAGPGGGRSRGGLPRAPGRRRHVVVQIGRYLTRPCAHGGRSEHSRECSRASRCSWSSASRRSWRRRACRWRSAHSSRAYCSAGSEYRHALETDIEPFKGLLAWAFSSSPSACRSTSACVAATALMIAALVVGLPVIKGARRCVAVARHRRRGAGDSARSSPCCSRKGASSRSSYSARHAWPAYCRQNGRGD